MASDTLDSDDDNRPLSEQLKEAITKVREQIERQISTPSWGPAGEITPGGKPEALAELEDELARLEEALAGLPDGA